MAGPNIPFSGFPKELIQFLNELKDNNNRDWFQANKYRYEEDLLAPSLEFIAAMIDPLKKVSKHFVAIPKRTGGSLMRIYRDTRFAKDKTPYKTNVGIQFRHEMGKDVHCPGFYFHIDTENIFIGCGVWHPAGPVIKNIRQAIDEYQPRWKRIKNSPSFKKSFKFGGELLKRPPRGFEKDHPLIEDLKRKDHIVITHLKTNELFNKRIVEKTAAHFSTAKNYVKFLCDALHLPF